MLNNSPAWSALKDFHLQYKDTHLTHFFNEDDHRFKNYHLDHDDLIFDYSRTHLNSSIKSALIALAKQQNLEEWRDKMFAGEKINITENRSVLHTALRAQKDDVFMHDGENVVPEIHDILERMEHFTNAIHDGKATGYTGKKIDTIVNIGIGGSDLGPYMVCEALRTYKKEGINSFFVSNVDAEHLLSVLDQINAETTLFLIASKTFTTQETMTNAQSAKDWFLKQAGNDSDAVSKHFIALSTNQKAAEAFGILPENIFPFRDWVGGRYSLWSAIGLSIALSVGFDDFRSLLAGARSMDHHFKTAPLDQNIPVMMALIGIWYRNFWDMDSLAVLPYAQNLHRFPAFLQQLDMESNGKSVDRGGNMISYNTGPIVFGEPGTNGQHAFYQLIHQGTTIIPCDFIGIKNGAAGYEDHQTKLNANMIAQTTALMNGRSIEDSDGKTYKSFQGNRPSNIILLSKLSPYSLGHLIALYEHKVFAQGIIWNINSFDQWGVELGKVLTADILQKINSDSLSTENIHYKIFKS